MKNPTKNNTPATVNLSTNFAADGFVELIIDVVGGFIFRDRLKAAGFEFIRDPSDDAGGLALNGKANKRKPASWRRILVAVPPEVSDERAVNGIQQALQELEKLLNSILQGSRVRGARTAAAALSQKWNQTPSMQSITEELAAMESPWPQKTIQRPPFAA